MGKFGDSENILLALTVPVSNDRSRNGRLRRIHKEHIFLLFVCKLNFLFIVLFSVHFLIPIITMS